MNLKNGLKSIFCQENYQEMNGQKTSLFTTVEISFGHRLGRECFWKQLLRSCADNNSSSQYPYDVCVLNFDDFKLTLQTADGSWIPDESISM